MRRVVAIRIFRSLNNKQKNYGQKNHISECFFFFIPPMDLTWMNDVDTASNNMYNEQTQSPNLFLSAITNRL